MSSNFEMGAEQRELRREVAELARKLGPRVDDWERRSVAPRELFREMGSRRWMGPIVPQEYGGMGRGAME
jgi:butyryl-CoA dehydrogenase